MWHTQGVEVVVSPAGAPKAQHGALVQLTPHHLAPGPQCFSFEKLATLLLFQPWVKHNGSKIINSDCPRHGSGHLADGFKAGGHAVAAQGQAALALIAWLDGHALDAEAVNVDGHELGGPLDHLAEGGGVCIADPQHLVGVADLEGCGGHVLCLNCCKHDTAGHTMTQPCHSP